MSVSSSSYGHNTVSFVPADFEVPEVLETDRFRLRMLTVNDLIKDYDAVMTSTEHLQKVWETKWPDGLTLEQNLIDLGWHQKEFQRRRSFAYTVVSLDETRVVGCVYIDPASKIGYDAEVYLWARLNELASGLETELEAVVRTWLAENWPFKNVVFPGKDLSLDEWNNQERNS